METRQRKRGRISSFVLFFAATGLLLSLATIEFLNRPLAPPSEFLGQTAPRPVIYLPQGSPQGPGQQQQRDQASRDQWVRWYNSESNANLAADAFELLATRYPPSSSHRGAIEVNGQLYDLVSAVRALAYYAYGSGGANIALAQFQTLQTIQDIIGKYNQGKFGPTGSGAAKAAAATAIEQEKAKLQKDGLPKIQDKINQGAGGISGAQKAALNATLKALWKAMIARNTELFGRPCGILLEDPFVCVLYPEHAGGGHARAPLNIFSIPVNAFERDTSFVNPMLYFMLKFFEENGRQLFAAHATAEGYAGWWNQRPDKELLAGLDGLRKQYGDEKTLLRRIAQAQAAVVYSPLPEESDKQISGDEWIQKAAAFIQQMYNDPGQPGPSEWFTLANRLETLAGTKKGK